MGASVTTGNLNRHPLPRLLCYLDRKRFTGRLRLEETAQGPRALTLLDGAPVAMGPEAPQHLVQLFRSRERLSDDHAAAVLHRLAENGADVHRLLTEIGGLSPEEILKGRRYLLFAEAAKLFRERSAPFVLEALPRDRIPPELSAAAVEPLFLVHSGVRNTYDPERLTAELAPIGPHAIRLKPGAEEIASRMAFEPDEQRVLAYLQQGYWLLEDLCEATGDRSTTLVATYCLFCADALSAADRDSVPRLRPKRPVTRPQTPVPPPTPPSALRARAAAPASAPKAPDVHAAPGPGHDPAQKPTPQSVPAEGARVRPPEIPLDTGAHATAPRPRTPPPTASGQYAKARVPSAALRRAREAAEKLRSEGELKPEAETVLDELLERLEKMDGQNPFELLGLPLDTTPANVRKAYMDLVRRLHPDRLNALGLAALHEGADALFKRLTEANQTLSNPESLAEARRIYTMAAEGHDPEAATRAIEAEVDFQKGEVFFRKGDYAQAEQYFQRAVEGNPDEGEHLAMLAWTRYQRTDRALRSEHREATKADLVRALTLSPRCARGHYFLGKLHLEDKNTEAALECFRKATRLKRDYIEALREIRLIEMRRRRDSAPRRRSTLLDMFSRKNKK